MDRRELLGALSLGTASLLTSRSVRAADDDEKAKHKDRESDEHKHKDDGEDEHKHKDDGEDEGDHKHHHHDQIMEDCAEACEDCAEACETTFDHCFKLVEKGEKDHARAARLALDCAAFCNLALTLILRHSELMAESCRACAEACEKCGDECAKFDHEEMRECAKECETCEDACRKMVKAMREHGHDSSN